MTPFTHLSIRTRLSLIALLTCVTALGLSCAALFIHEAQSFKQGLVRDLQTQSATVAGLCTGALTFDDPKSADEVLAELKHQKHIRWAVIYRENRHFAQYRNPESGAELPQGAPADAGAVFRPDGLLLSSPIQHLGENLGWIEMSADTSQLRSRLWEYGRILLAVFLASSVIAIALASMLQRAIVVPVQRLADTARVIAERQDYSVRVEERGHDELGRLTAAFNHMLNRIQGQDAELREGRERYEVAVAGARDGIWDWNLATDGMYLSPQSQTILGYTAPAPHGRPQDWLDRIHPEDRDRVREVLARYLNRQASTYEVEFRVRHGDDGHRWILARGAALWDVAGKPHRMAGSHTDITERKQAAEQLERMQRELMDASRLAGMAEVATGVLHNVGNVLNSVNVSATLVVEQLRKSKTASLARAVQLLGEHTADVGEFLSSDPKGRQLPAFLAAVSEQLTREQELLARETLALQQKIEHIKQIVAMQQSYAKVSGVLEHLSVRELVEDALRMTAGTLARHEVEVVREFATVPPVLVDRHKVLQILVNLVNNAKDALGHREANRRLVLRITPADSQKVRIEVCDNGVGIAPENLIRIFQHAFTTKKAGHGFGLHSGANAARELGGRLGVHSDGPGTGATFTLELPVADPAHKPPAPSADD